VDAGIESRILLNQIASLVPRLGPSFFYYLVFFLETNEGKISSRVTQTPNEILRCSSYSLLAFLRPFLIATG
jgi:hypothetical protein